MEKTSCGLLSSVKNAAAEMAGAIAMKNKTAGE
jgi:hypothetical protein